MRVVGDVAHMPKPVHHLHRVAGRIELLANRGNEVVVVHILNNPVLQRAILDLTADADKRIPIVESDCSGDEIAVLVCNGDGVRLINDPKGQGIPAQSVSGGGEPLVIDRRVVQAKLAHTVWLP